MPENQKPASEQKARTAISADHGRGGVFSLLEFAMKDGVAVQVAKSALRAHRLLYGATPAPPVPAKPGEGDQEVTAPQESADAESTQSSVQGTSTPKRRPTYKRNALWLEWAEEIGLDAANVEGQVRDKWNESPDEVRQPCKPYHQKVPHGKTGYDRVRKGIKQAQEDQKAEGES